MQAALLNNDSVDYVEKLKKYNLDQDQEFHEGLPVIKNPKQDVSTV
jgi:hypothetical protein